MGLICCNNAIGEIFAISCDDCNYSTMEFVLGSAEITLWNWKNENWFWSGSAKKAGH